MTVNNIYIIYYFRSRNIEFMKFIDKIIKTPPDNRIHWLWTPKIDKYKHLLDISYKDALIKYYNCSDVLIDLLKYFDKKKKYPSLFIFVIPFLDISFFRTLIEIKDGLIPYKEKIIIYDMPHVFVISHMEPVPRMITVHKFAIYYLSCDK